MPKGSWREFEEPVSEDIQYNEIRINSKADFPVRVHKTRGGKRGKTVTVISGLALHNKQMRSFLKKLKTSCGAGGTLKGDLLELQGDHVHIAIKILQEEGYRPKQSGG